MRQLALYMHTVVCQKEIAKPFTCKVKPLVKHLCVYMAADALLISEFFGHNGKLVQVPMGHM